MYRVTVSYYEPADPEDFQASYVERHVPLVQRLPGLSRFTLSRPRGEGAPALQAELWFEDGAASKAAMTSPPMQAVAADAETYDVGRREMHAGEVEDLPVTVEG